MTYRLPFIRPVFPSADLISVDIQEIVDANWYTNFGPKERAFSSEIAARFGADYHAVTFNNATIALMAALHVTLGRGDGTRFVVVPSFTFAAGPQAIEWAGYRPFFVDIDPVTLQPALGGLSEALASRPGQIAGVLLCNTFGMGNPDIDAWEALAREAGIPVVVDSAAGFGSEYPGGRMVGTGGHCEVFSFHATKPFAIGEGGAVVTRDGDFAARLKEFTNFGFHASEGAVALGLNGKLQEISAAIGLRQLRAFDEVKRARQSVAARYRELLDERISVPPALETSSVCFATVLMPDNVTRDRARARLIEAGVEARSYYSPPVHRQPHFTTATRSADLHVTEDVVDRVISVPVYSDMADEEIALIAGILSTEITSI